jgi:predicted metal-dependent hydrolase
VSWKRKDSNGWTPLERVVPKDIFRSEVEAWCQRIGVHPKEIHVRPMTRKWGSCSTAGRVSFSADLLAESAAFRKKVIVHELVHLKVPNHGKLFKALLKAYLGLDELRLPSPMKRKHST